MNDTPPFATPTRNPDGTFAPGNPGGPGRPRRATEAAYLRILGDTVTPEDWRAIVARAVADAIAGDGKARDWLARHMLGPEPLTLQALAAMEELGVTDDHLIRGEAKYHMNTAWVLNPRQTPIERAHDVKTEEDEAAEVTRRREERARRKAERQAQKAEA